MEQGPLGNPSRVRGLSPVSARRKPSDLAAVVVLLIVLAVPLFATVPVGGLPTPSPSVGIEPGPSDARTPSLAVDATGFMHVVRSDNVSGERGVYYTQSTNDGLTWTPGVRIDTPGTPAFLPRIAVEREPIPIRGRLYVAYQTGSPSDIWFTVSDGGAFWFPPRLVDGAPAGSISNNPSIAASNARVYVAFSDNRVDPMSFHLFVRTSPNGGASWGPEIQLSSAGISNLQSRVDAKSDTAVIVWRQASPTGTSILSARTDDGGASWRPSVLVTTPTPSDNPRDPEVYLDELGVAHAVWAYQLPTRETHIWYASSGDGLTWSAPVRVDDMLGGVIAGAPSIAGVAGTLWVSWHDARNGDYDVFASWSTDGVTWGDGLLNGNDLRVDDTDRNPVGPDDATGQGNVTLRTGGFGVFAAWEDLRNGATPDVYFSSVQVSPLVITEVQDEPASEARLEIYNFGQAPFPVTGATLMAGATNVDLSPLGSIGGRGHVTVGAAAGSDLVASLDLGTEGARVEIVRGTDVLASAGSGTFGIAPDPLPGESTARYAGTLDYTPAWTRAATPSFKSRNAVPVPDAAPAIVLNEVLFNPSVPNERFVELRLRGAGPVDLTGHRLVSDMEYALSGTVGAANPYAFVLEGRSPAWFTGLTASGDNVYLYDPAGRLLDMVGWSSAHAAGATVSRVTPGAGGLRAFDDASAPANGWAFDVTPSLPLLDLAADARQMADVGTTVSFPLTATNLQPASEYVNVVYSTVTSWPVVLTWPSGTPLTDSIGDPDPLPDLGSVPPGASVSFLAEVTVPVEGQIGHGNLVNVTAIAASLPVARDWVTLAVDLFPHFDVTRALAPSPVYREGSGPPYNEVSQITIAVTGAGLPMVQQVPIDVVWQIDTSGSMGTNDPTNLRVDAVNFFIDNMRVDDRGAVIGFNTVAWYVNNRPLTYTDAMGKQTLKDDANTTRFANGATNIDAAIQLGNDLLIAQGNRSRPRIEILLTDGVCTVPQFGPCPNTNNLINQAVTEGLVIYTIGLGSAIDQAFLDNIATQTGGRYYHANTPQDLQPIYEEIGLRINRTAGVDPDVTDNVPMIEDHLAPYVHVVPGTFYDPATGFPRPPDFMQQFGDRTRVQWNVSRIQINETWSVRFSVTSSQLGVQNVALHPDARVSYIRWDGSTVFQPIPQGTLEVLRAPSPPQITATTPADGTTNVPLTQPIFVTFSQDMDKATVQWSISPPIAQNPPQWAGRILLLEHGGFAECTRYTVHVTQGQDLDGEALVPGPVPNPWSFDTMCPLRVRYTITRSPEVGDVFVDNVSYAAPVTFVWLVGESHRLFAPDFDPYGPSRLAFLAWDDGGARDHFVTVGDTDRTITAGYALQHPATLTLLGLEVGRPAGVRFRLWGTPSQAAQHAAWSDWVDDGSPLDVDGLVAGIPGERFITLDERQWTVAGPIAKTVRYHHQFTATVRLSGLQGHDVTLDYRAFGANGNAAANATWTSWVDAGANLRVDELLSIGPRERYRTLETTRWRVDAPLAENVGFIHQFRPRVTLNGTDANHTVGATWREDGRPTSASGLVDESYRWADAGALLRFDDRTTGEPTRYAQDATTFEVTTAFDATIRYAAEAPAPPPANWKPILAFVYTVGLLVAGWAGSRRLIDRYVPRPREGDRRTRKHAWKGLPVGRKFSELSIAEVEEKVHRDRVFTRSLLLAPFAGLETALGILSYLTGALRIPEAGSWLPLGFWANTFIVAAGVAASLAVWRRGYRMTEEALLRLAEARAKAAEKAKGHGAEDGAAKGAPAIPAAGGEPPGPAGETTGHP